MRDKTRFSTNSHNNKKAAPEEAAQIISFHYLHAQKLAVLVIVVLYFIATCILDGTDKDINT